MELSADEQSLLIVGIAYLAGAAVWAWTATVRANILLRELAERMDPAIWRELGEPASIRHANADPERRWHRFVRQRQYRRRCSAEVVDLIDDFRRRQTWMICVFAGAGLLIAYRYRDLLFDALLG